MPPENGHPTGESDAARALSAILPGAVADAVVEALGGGARIEEVRSPEMGELVKALCRARPNFGVVEKSRTATVKPKEAGKPSYTYDYSTLADAVSATANALAAEELAVFQAFEQPSGQRAVVIVTELHHGSGQWRRSKLTMPVAADAGPQGIGSSITYGRRYAYWALLNLAPEVDDDGAAAQRGVGREPSAEDALTPEELMKLAATDPEAAIAAVRRAVAAAAGCGDISEARLGRLYALAAKDRGWPRDAVDAACVKRLEVPAAKIPWKAYDLVVELFRALLPSVMNGEVRQQPPAQSRPAAAPPPAEQTAPPKASWAEAWSAIREMYGQLSAEARAEVVDKPSMDAILEVFAKAGWHPRLIEGVLRVELQITPLQVPKDGSQPPVFRAIAKAFRLYSPQDIPAEDRERYGAAWDDAPPAAMPDAGAGPGLTDLLQRLAGTEMPDTADAAWSSIRSVLEEVITHHPAAATVIPPDDRLTLFTRGRNGNRASADVAALVNHHLGMPIEKLPSIAFEAVLRVLAHFPARGPGKEEVLGRLPADPGKSRLVQLRDLLHALIRDGVITDEDVPRTGANGTVSKGDMLGVVEGLRERALAEAGNGA